MTNIRRKIQTIFQEMGQTVGTVWAAPERANIGNPSSGEILVSGGQRQVYIHFPGDESRGATIALQGQFSRKQLIMNRPVWVVKNDAGQYELDKLEAASDAIFSDGIEDVHDQSPVLINQLMYGTLQPVAGILKVLIIGAMYDDDFVTDQLTVDFSTSPLDTASAAINIPTTNNRAIGVLIQLDAATNTLEYKQSSEFIATMPLSVAYSNSLLSAPDSARFRLGYIKLVKGMTTTDTFGYDQIWVVPELLTSSVGDVTGPGSSTDNAIVRFDGAGGKTLQDSGVLIDDNDKTTLPDSATIAPLSLTERSAAPSSPVSGDVYLDDGTNTDSGQPGLKRYTGSVWESMGAANSQFAILEDQKATTVDGGGASATTWNARDLNTEVHDPDALISISSNEFTPAAGDYRIFARAPAFDVLRHKLRLYNVTGAAVVKLGDNAYTGTSVQTIAFLDEVFTANGTDAYRIDHYTQNAQATNGLGNSVDDGGTEIYLVIYLEKAGD